MLTIVRSSSRRLGGFVLAVMATSACGGGSEHARSDTATAATTPAGKKDSATLVRGTVASASSTNLAIKTETGTVTVKLEQPLQMFAREPAKLADVTQNSFVGVSTVKQPDGSEQATEIHIFPEVLRGLGEGSRMMTQNTGGGAGNRMTNGAVSATRMMNGMMPPSRMSNGNVASANGSMLVVQYAGGSLNINVPPNTKVTVIKATTKSLAVGDQVVVIAHRTAEGPLAAQRVLLVGK